MKKLLAAVVLLLLVAPNYVECETTTETNINAKKQVDSKTGDKQAADRVVARIDNTPIMLSEIDEKVTGFTDKFREINPDMKFSEERLNKMRKSFLDRIVRERILENASKTVKIEVTKKEIDDRIEQFQKIFGEGESAQEKFMSGIKDMEKFRKEVKKQIRIDKYFDSLAKDRVQITEEAIKEYYDSHQDRFVSHEMVKAKQILWSLPPAEADDYSTKLAEARKNAEEVTKAVQSGEEFSKYAKKFSADIKTAENGGDLGWVAKGKMAKNIEDILFGLHAGELSKPIETPTGMYLFQVNEKKEKGSMSLDDARERIKSVLENKSKSSLRSKIYEDLKNNAKIEILL